jgi:hypothetical protein
MAYAFFKTSRDAHYISQGTVVKRIKVLSQTEIDMAIENIINSYIGSEDKERIRAKILSDIEGCLKDAGNSQLIEILELDNENTSPLTHELNKGTKKLFTNKRWLNRYGAKIGSDSIMAGMRLPPLPRTITILKKRASKKK